MKLQLSGDNGLQIFILYWYEFDEFDEFDEFGEFLYLMFRITYIIAKKLQKSSFCHSGYSSYLALTTAEIC